MPQASCVLRLSRRRARLDAAVARSGMLTSLRGASEKLVRIRIITEIFNTMDHKNMMCTRVGPKSLLILSKTSDDSFYRVISHDIMAQMAAYRLHPQIRHFYRRVQYKNLLCRARNCFLLQLFCFRLRS